MARFKAVRTDRELECPDIDAGLRAAGCELVLLPEGISEDDLIAAVRDCDLLLMCYTPVTARVIAAAEKLKGIVKYGVGIDAIDIPAAIARGIPVVNVPEYAEETVAEGAFALMIALAKKLMPIGREMDAKGWAWPTPQWLGLDLAGRTLGIVGTGKIGRSMARMASGFRMRVIGYRPLRVRRQMRAGGIEKVDDLRALLAVERHRVDPRGAERRDASPDRRPRTRADEAVSLPDQRLARRHRRRGRAGRGLTREGDRGRCARRVQPGTDARRASDGRALRDGQRDPVPAPDLLHRGSDARA